MPFNDTRCFRFRIAFLNQGTVTYTVNDEEVGVVFEGLETEEEIFPAINFYSGDRELRLELVEVAGAAIAQCGLGAAAGGGASVEQCGWLTTSFLRCRRERCWLVDSSRSNVRVMRPWWCVLGLCAVWCRGGG